MDGIVAESNGTNEEVPTAQIQIQVVCYQI